MAICDQATTMGENSEMMGKGSMFMKPREESTGYSCCKDRPTERELQGVLYYVWITVLVDGNIWLCKFFFLNCFNKKQPTKRIEREQ